MYLDYFGLTDFPFIQSARNELYFATEESQAHCAATHHWLDAGHGMLTIAGENGVGRSALAHHALDTTPLPVLERYVVSSLPLSPADLLRSIALQMGLSPTSNDAIQIRHEIRSHLRAQASLSRRVCLLVHDAGELDVQTHAFLEDLSKDHTLYLPLCHIILLADKAFATRVSRQKRRTDARHIYKLITVKPLTQEQTSAYIAHRFSQACATGQAALSESVFPAAVSKMIFRQTLGKPQLINALCDAALMQAYLDETTVVGSLQIQRAVSSIGWESRLKSKRGELKSAKVAKKTKKKAGTSAASKSAPRGTRKAKGRQADMHAQQKGGLGALEQSVHELISGVTTIGRAPDCSIRIDGDTISPYQALIVRTDDGMFIRNEATQLPLYLNGDRIESANLSAGDSVTIGSYQFSVALDAGGTLNLVSGLAAEN